MKYQQDHDIAEAYWYQDQNHATEARSRPRLADTNSKNENCYAASLYLFLT